MSASLPLLPTRPDRIDYLLTLVALLDEEAAKAEPPVTGTREEWSAHQCLIEAAVRVHSAACWLGRMSE